MSTWHFQTRKFLLPKGGYQFSECEDAIGINPVSRRFAIADGATEAFDAQSWARRLAHNWVELEPATLTANEFRTWATDEGRSLHDSWSGLHLSWYAEEKARTGSFAAFVGVQFDLEADTPCWRAIAIGDSCLIHCRNKAIVKTLPLSTSKSFNATPVLVPSYTAMHEAALQGVVCDSNTIESEDVVLLLSDAVAAWYLMLVETDDQMRASFDHLLGGSRDGELGQLFESERLAGRIKDDDIAAVSIRLRSEEPDSGGVAFNV